MALTAAAVGKRPVGDGPAGLQLVILVTSITELIGAHFDGQRLGNIGCLMALRARLRIDMRVNAVRHQPGSVRRMRIVALQASCLLHRITAVSGPEALLLMLVAAAAEHRIVLPQQIIKGRAVGKMARQAVFGLQRFVDDFFIEVLFSVALKAKIIAGRDQQLAVIRGMRVVAADALPLLQSAVHDWLIHSELFCVVAVDAELVTLFLQDQFWYDAVPKVAVLAFFLLYHCVDIAS